MTCPMLNETTSDRQARDVTDVANGALGGRGSREFTSLEGKVPVASRFVFKGTVLLHCLAFRLYSFLPSVFCLSHTHTHARSRASSSSPITAASGCGRNKFVCVWFSGCKIGFWEPPTATTRSDRTVSESCPPFFYPVIVEASEAE